MGLGYRAVSAEEFGLAADRFQKGPPHRCTLLNTLRALDTRMPAMPANLSPQSRDLALYLQALNRKVDLLARLVASEKEPSPGETTQPVSLSAAGVAFRSAAAQQQGTYLDVGLVLFPERLHVRTYGRVARCAHEPTADEEFPFLIAVEFLLMWDADREALIQHVLQRQAAQLREIRRKH